MPFYRHKILFLFSAIIISLLFGAGARATTISPLVLEVNLDPGQSDSRAVILMNEGSEDLKITGYIEAFKPRGERGEAEIYKPDINFQAANWVKLPTNTLVLKPGVIKRVPVVFEIPKTAAVGGYYLAVMWETAPAKGKNSAVGVSSRVGTLILLRVKGEAQEKLSVDEFKIASSQKFYSHLPVDFSARLSNQGNVHLKPAGQLNLKNILYFGSASVDFNPDGGNILPQSVRQFDFSWQKNSPLSSRGFWSGLKEEWRNFGLGYYTARLDLLYGDSGQKITSNSVSFWVMPWRTILLLLILIILIFSAKKILRRKKYYRPLKPLR